jgi:heme/copper-type cytochrome/quinol oxidase subunit 2
MNATKRFWLYAVALVTLGILAIGVGDLISLFFDAVLKNNTLTGGGSYNQQQLSLGVAMIVIGGPLWFFFWRAIQHRAKGSPEETGAALRKLYLNFIMLETAIMALTAAAGLFQWVFSGAASGGFSTTSQLTLLIVGGVIWFYHWRVSEHEGQPTAAARTLRRWYMYILSGFGLVWLCLGIVGIIGAAFANLPWWENTLVPGKFWDSGAQTALAQIILGAGVWYFHWFRMAKDDAESRLRQVYFYLLTITGGAITALTATVIFLFRLVNWATGGAPVSNNSHFQFLGWAIPTILVGLAVWGYHTRAAQEEAGQNPEKRQAVQRIYLYLMAFIGLVTMIAGLSNLTGILFGSTVLSINSTGWWRSPLSLGLAMTIVGVPMWLYYWKSILKYVQTNSAGEARALPRRIFLYAVIGISIIMLTADLVNIVYQALSGAMQHTAGASYLHNAKWSLETLPAVAATLWYYWLILREDQRRGAEVVVNMHSVTLLANDPKGELAARLGAKLGYKIRSIYPVGLSAESEMVISEAEISDITSQIQAAQVNTVMVMLITGRLAVVPYQEKR